MPNRLFVLTAGAEKGPFTAAEIVEMVGRGELTRYDFLRREEDARWVPAGAVRPLADLFGDLSPAREGVEAVFEVGDVEAPAATCPVCHAAAEGDAAFCTVCGAPLGAGGPAREETACPHCGRPAAPDARFCTGCGRPLDAPAEAAPETPAGAADEPSERPPRESRATRAPAERAGGFGRAGKLLAVAGGAAVIVAAALATGLVLDRIDNGRIDGSLIGREAGAVEDSAAPTTEVPAPAREGPAPNPTMSFEVISAWGGGRPRGEVMDGLTANKERFEEAFAGSDEGVVVARITVARNGAVVAAEAERSTFDDPAIRDRVASALRTCRFEPAEGTTVAVVRIGYVE